MLAYILHVNRLYSARWIVKMDDDVYLNPSRLLLAMRQWNSMHADYVGCMKHGVVISQSSSKWFEPNHLLLGRECAPTLPFPWSARWYDIFPALD